jgi:diguanylate cyclase (GGDEF)-like protein
MVKNLRHDPIFKKRQRLLETPLRTPSKELLLKYRRIVDRTIASRVSFMTYFIGVVVYLAFHVADRVVYPAHAFLFLKIRISISIITAMICALNLFEATKKYSVWTSDLIVTLLVAGICSMIYLTDGASSHYHAGINILLLGMAIANPFYFWHNMVTGLIALALYAAAVLACGVGWNGSLFFVSCFFIASSVMLVTIMTALYRSLHFQSFAQHEQLKEDERKLEILYGMADEKSKIDDLTKIYNRRYFFEILAEKIKTCKAQNSFFFLIIFDIDHFKKINDGYGHIFGDQVISTVARVVRDMMRLKSYIGRFGGDEFMLIIDKATREELLMRLQDIRRSIRDLRFFYEGKKVSLSASFGAARWESGMKDERKLIELADAALFDVKRTRRGEIKLAN